MIEAVWGGGGGEDPKGAWGLGPNLTLESVLSHLGGWVPKFLPQPGEGKRFCT